MAFENLWRFSDVFFCFFFLTEMVDPELSLSRCIAWLALFGTESVVVNIKQLLDEVEHDIMNYQSRGLCYLPKPKAEADNTDTRV